MRACTRPRRGPPLAGAWRTIVPRPREEISSPPPDIRGGRIPIFSTHLVGTKAYLDCGHATGAGMADVRGTCAIPFLAWRPLACLRRVLGFSFGRPRGTEPLYRGPPPARRVASHTCGSRHSKRPSLFNR